MTCDGRCGCLVKRMSSNQTCSNERSFHSWPWVREKSLCGCVFVSCMLIPLWWLVWIMQPTASMVSHFEWLFKPEQALIMHARMCVIPDPHSPSGTDRLGGNHDWAMMKAVIGAHTKHDTDESLAPTCLRKQPLDWPVLVNNKTGGARGKAEQRTIDLLLLRENHIGWFVFSPSFGFSALDRQPSERVFYRSQRAHRLTAHDPQHWMMNGERRPHPSQLRPLFI